MSTRRRFAAALAFVASLTVAGSLFAEAHYEKKSLYTRLGGYDAIAAVTDDFIPRLAGDPTLGKFFGGHSKDSLGKIRQHVVEFICAATGGPCVYTGRDMKTSHAGLGITKAEWDIGVKHLLATLDQLVAAVAGLEKDIVETP